MVTELLQTQQLTEADETELTDISLQLMENKIAADNLERQRAHLRERLFRKLDLLGYSSKAIFYIAETGMKLGRDIRIQGKDQWDADALQLILGQQYDQVSEWKQVLIPERLESAILAGILRVSEEQLEKCRKKGKSITYLIHDTAKGQGCGAI